MAKSKKKKKDSKLVKRVFKHTYKKGDLVFLKGEVVTMSPCEAKEYERFTYPLIPGEESDCGC